MPRSGSIDSIGGGQPVRGGGAVGQAQLAGRTVAVARPRAPRAGRTGFLAGASRLGTRVLNALTPRGVRADSKIRVANADYAERLGGMLTRLSADQASGNGVLNELGDLREEANPITSRGGDYDRLLQSHLRAALAGLDDQSLSRVARFLQGDSVAAARDALLDGPSQEERAVLGNLAELGLVDADELGSLDDPTLARDLSVLQSLVQEEQTNRVQGGFDRQVSAELRGVLNEALSEVPRERDNPGAVDYVFSKTHGIVSATVDSLVRSGAVPRGDRGIAKSGLIKESLATLGTPQATALLQHVSGEELEQLRAGRSPFGTDTSGVDALIRNEITGRRDRQVSEVRRLAEAVSGGDLDPGDDASAFVATLKDLRNAVEAMREHGDRFDLDLSGADSALTESLTSLDGLNTNSVDLDALSNAELHAYREALSFLGVEHLDETLGAAVTQRKQAAVQNYNTAMGQLLTAVRGGDAGAVVAGLTQVAAAAETALQVHNELGAGIDDPDKFFTFSKKLLDDRLANESSQDLQRLFAAFRQPGMESLSEGLADVGYAVLSDDDALGKQLLTAGRDLGRLEQAVAARLETTHGMSLPPPTAEPPENAVGALPQGAKDALRRLGVQVGHAQEDTYLTATRGPAPDPRSRTLGDLSARLVNEAIRDGADASQLIQIGHAFNHTFYASQPPQVLADMEDRQAAKVHAFRGALAGSSDAQIQLLFDRLASRRQSELRAAMAGVAYMGTGSDVPSDEELAAQGQLGAVAENLDAVLEAVKQEMTARNLPFEAPPEPHMPESFSGFSAGVQRAVRDGVALLANANRIPGEGVAGNGDLSQGFRTLVADQLALPASGSVAAKQSVDEIDTGVCKQFYSDLGRATFTLEGDEGPVPLMDNTGFGSLAPDAQNQRRAGAIDGLREYVGDDQLLRASQFLNQSIFAGAEVALMSPESPLKLDDAWAMPIRGGGPVRYHLSKTDGGDLVVRASVSWALKGVQVDGNTLPVDHAASSLTVGMTVTLPADGGPPQLGNATYDFRMTRSPDLTVE